MNYQILQKQIGGVRPYPCGSYSIPDTLPRPFTREEALDIAHKCADIMALNIRRNSGFHFALSFIKPGSVGAEIGVDFGDGAVRFLRALPGKLYLVDPWQPTKGYDSWTDVTEEEMGVRYEMVCRRFAADDRVEIRRETSDSFFASRPELDWVYIDGDHGEHAVYRDLVGALSCIKSEGYIFGDDLHTTKWNAPIGRALERFVGDYESRVELLWNDCDPFILQVR